MRTKDWNFSLPTCWHQESRAEQLAPGSSSSQARPREQLWVTVGISVLWQERVPLTFWPAAMCLQVILEIPTKNGVTRNGLLYPTQLIRNNIPTRVITAGLLLSGYSSDTQPLRSCVMSAFLLSTDETLPMPRNNSISTLQIPEQHL